MKIPKTLKFLGFTISIELVSSDILVKEGWSDGYYNFKKRFIRIDKTLNPEKQQEVLFHEIAEMLVYYLNVSYDDWVGHRGFSRCISLWWAILKENNLLK